MFDFEIRVDFFFYGVSFEMIFHKVFCPQLYQLNVFNSFAIIPTTNIVVLVLLCALISSLVQFFATVLIIALQSSPK